MWSTWVASEVNEVDNTGSLATSGLQFNKDSAKVEGVMPEKKNLFFENLKIDFMVFEYLENGFIILENSKN